MPKPTAAQQAIIDSRCQSLLVSASAGTGKTTVMIDRITELLVREDADISNLLVITFTKSAAAEMKNRLIAKLNDEAIEHPVLYRKLTQIDSAQISTIHSFCNTVIKSYFYIADIDPSYTLMDDSQSAVLRTEVLKKVFADYYRAADNDFFELTEIFGKRSDEGLASIVLRLYSFRESQPDYDKWIAETTHTNAYYDEIILHHIKALAEKYTSDIRSLDYRDEFTDSLLAALDFQTLSSPFDCLNRYRECNFDTRAIKTNHPLKAIHKSVSNAFKEVLEYYGEDSDRIRERTASTLEIIAKLHEIVKRFDTAYKAVKYKRGTLDYSDLEALTIKILADERAFSQLKNRFKYVFVDEYQDVNDIQESIIERISQNGNLFLVGDVKQSIYGFRMSEPRNLIGRANRYVSSNNAELHGLQDNFRSDNAILGFVNDVFSDIMTTDFGKTDYKSTSSLRGNFSSNPTCQPVKIVFCGSSVKGESELASPYSIDDSGLDALPVASAAASSIRELVGTTIETPNGARAITFSDIAVLARTKKTLTECYTALAEQDIPVSLCYKRELYDGEEIRSLISFLRVVDNPRNDIDLYASLTGFFGKMTLDEVALLRLASTEADFYTVALDSNDEKILHFKELLDGYRLYADSMSGDEIVSHLVNTTDFRGYVLRLPEGASRLALLDAFLALIHKKPECRTLSSMLAFLDDCNMNGSTDGLSDSESVKLMTVHSAKGLEFPVVILLGSEKVFKSDTTSVVISKQGGIALKYYDKNDKTVYPTLSHFAVSLENKLKNREEELRLLYVALTRAKYRLIIPVGRDGFDSTDKPSSLATNCFYWISYAMTNTYKGDRVAMATAGIECTQPSDYETASRTPPLPVYPSPSEDSLNEFQRRMAFVYPKAMSYSVPVKIVSSRLYDEAEEETVVCLDDSVSPETLSLPSGVSYAEIGTAYHRLLENCDFFATDERELDFRISELISAKKLSSHIMDYVDRRTVLATLNDSNLAMLIGKKRVYRERPFLASLNYSELDATKPPYPVILQGIIDLLAIDDEGVIILDFKYTTHENPDYLAGRYMAQLHSYRLAVQRVLKPKRIDCYLYNIAHNRIISL